VFAPRDKPEIASVVLIENAGFGGFIPLARPPRFINPTISERVNSSRMRGQQTETRTLAISFALGPNRDEI
jgi:hypothetical protein